MCTRVVLCNQVSAVKPKLADQLTIMLFSCVFSSTKGRLFGVLCSLDDDRTQTKLEYSSDTSREIRFSLSLPLFHLKPEKLRVLKSKALQLVNFCPENI
jgi:hypothetical protein